MIHSLPDVWSSGTDHTEIAKTQTFDTLSVIGNGVPLGDDGRPGRLPMGIDGLDPLVRGVTRNRGKLTALPVTTE